MDLHEPLGRDGCRSVEHGPALGARHWLASSPQQRWHANPLSEVVYLAEAVDLAMHRKYRFDMKVVLFDGKVKVDHDRFRELLERLDVPTH